MSPDRGAADRLSDHLDAVVAGDDTRSHNLDPSIGATVARFFAADDAPGPPPGLADHLWSELMGHPASVELVPRVPALRSGRNGRTPLPPRHTAPPHHGPSAVALLATAALVLLTLIGGFVAIRGPLRLMDPDHPAVIIPAIESAPESLLPSGVTADVILLRATLEEFPSWGNQLAANRFRLAPGAVQPGGSQADTGLGLNLFAVESGQVTVEADAPVLVTRAVANPAAAPSPVPTGTAIVLEAGDQLYAPSGVSFRRRNDGLDPATVQELSLGSVGDLWRTRLFPAGVTVEPGLPYKFLTEYPTVPAEATVHRLTLAPGAELAIRDLPGLELVYVEAGALDLVNAKAETPATPERAFTIYAGSGTETFGGAPEGAVLANRGAEPLVILTASVVPASAGEETPQAPWSDGWASGDRPQQRQPPPRPASRYDD